MKYLKIIILLITISLSSGCIFEPKVTTEIKLANNLTYNYGDKVYIYDLVQITDGTIIDQNYLVDTTNIGDNKIKISYKDSNKHKKSYEFNINIIDNEKPLLSVPKNQYVVQNNEINLFSKVFYGDNATRQVQCEITGDYDLTTVGDYDLTYTATDESNNTTIKNSTLHVIEKPIDTTTKEDEGKPINYYIKNYKDSTNQIGIDISSYQKDVDFNKVKDAGVDFVILRIGYGPDSDGNMTIDNNFEIYYNAAKEAGLKIGIYLFSYATTIEEANIQSDWILDELKDKDIDLPIAYDWESWYTFSSCNLNFYDLNDIAKTFLDNIKNNNYQVMLYGSKYYLDSIWNLPEYNTWLAQYYSEATYNKAFNMWQLTDEGTVDGIDTKVDIDILKAVNSN